MLNPKLIVAALLLWGVFFLEYQVPLAVGLLLSAGGIVWLIIRSGRADVVVWLVLVNVIYWLLSGLIFGGIRLPDFASPKFYNGDGRIFISLMPLVLYCLWSMRLEELTGIVRTVAAVACATLAIYLIWSVTHTRLFSGQGHADEFHGLLTSHTGAGTFFGSLFVFTLLYGYWRRDYRLISLGLLLIAPVIATGSREALVGILGVLVWLILVKLRRFGLFIGAAVFLVISFAMLPVISEKTYNRMADVVSVEFALTVIDQAESAAGKNWQTGDWIPGEDVENLEEGDVTSLVRVLLWTYAAKKILDSPLLGMGWGRFNDRNVDIVELPGIGAFAMDGRKVFSTSNAHNSYFHIGSESGLIGIVLFFGMWIYIYLRLGELISGFRVFPQVSAFGLAAQGLIVFAAGCALTGHAFGAPSSMIILTLLCGAGLAFRRTSVIRDVGDVEAVRRAAG